MEFHVICGPSSINHILTGCENDNTCARRHLHCLRELFSSSLLSCRLLFSIFPIQYLPATKCENAEYNHDRRQLSTVAARRTLVLFSSHPGNHTLNSDILNSHEGTTA